MQRDSEVEISCRFFFETFQDSRLWVHVYTYIFTYICVYKLIYINIDFILEVSRVRTCVFALLRDSLFGACYLMGEDCEDCDQALRIFWNFWYMYRRFRTSRLANRYLYMFIRVSQSAGARAMNCQKNWTNHALFLKICDKNSKMHYKQ